MAYEKTNWQNTPSTQTPLSASNLNKMEYGIRNNSLNIENLDTAVQTNTTNIGTLTNLTTTAKSNLVSAINEVNTGYNNIKGTILWTNPNPSSSISSETNISLNSNDYDILDIVWRLSTSNNFMQSNRLIKGYGTRLYYGNNYRPITRNSDTSFTIGIASDSSSPSAIPLYIIGYKTGLFN